jgi:diacylglycerol kinase family enzyme
VLFNPASTRAVDSLKRIIELERLYPQKVEIITTTTGGRDANIAALVAVKKRLTKDVLLCVAAGDGTVNIAVEALATAGLKAPLLPLWGGNANDLAYMLNGASFAKRLRSVFRRSQIIPIYPLECTITSGNKRESRLAACYISFGMSGFSAHRMNDEIHREHIRRKRLTRFAHELGLVWRIFTLAPWFHVQEGDTTHRVYEMVFANGSRIAKVDRLPVRLGEQAFYRDTLEHKKLGKIFRKVVGVLRGGLKQSRVTRPVHLVFKDTVWAQFDGEPVRIKAGSAVEIRLCKKPFYAVASSTTVSGRSAKRNRLGRFVTRHTQLLKVLSLLASGLVVYWLYTHTY